MQTSAVALTAGEYLPASQLIQTLAPDAALYFPASQLAQASPLAPEKPALHLQSDNSLLAAGASELAGHIKHWDSNVAPSAVEYFAVPQSLQVPAPITALYLPASQL